MYGNEEAAKKDLDVQTSQAQLTGDNSRQPRDTRSAVMQRSPQHVTFGLVDQYCRWVVIGQPDLPCSSAFWLLVYAAPRQKDKSATQPPYQTTLSKRS